MNNSRRIGCAIIGSGNIGTDLMFKVLRNASNLELTMLIGIDPKSDGIDRARRLGIPTTHLGIDGFLSDEDARSRTNIVFDATSAKAHLRHAPLLKEAGIVCIDLTPAAIGPYVVPTVNLHDHIAADNVNMITCGGQATIPIVYAISRVAEVPYAEMVSSIASKSAGPGTRQNIDEFTQTTARGLEVIGGAMRGKAIIILNPAEPPIIMRNTVYALVRGDDESAIAESINLMVQDVQAYVPGFRLTADPVLESLKKNPITIPGVGRFDGFKVTVLIEVEGAAHYHPSYAGNLDIMTASAIRVGEVIAEKMLESIPNEASR